MLCERLDGRTRILLKEDREISFIEPVLMLIFMLVLPPLFGGQIMIWWSTVLARVFSAILAFILIKYCEKGDLQYGIQKI